MNLASLTYTAANLGPMKGSGVPDAEYRLVVRGELADRFAYLFNGMRMERVAGTTVLTGPVRDRAQLNAFLERIEELGLEILSLTRTNEPAAEDRRP